MCFEITSIKHWIIIEVKNLLQRIGVYIFSSLFELFKQYMQLGTFIEKVDERAS